MKKLIFLIAVSVLIVILLQSSTLAVSDTTPIDNNIPDNEAIASPTKASNSSAGASITITWYTGDGE